MRIEHTTSLSGWILKKITIHEIHTHTKCSTGHKNNLLWNPLSSSQSNIHNEWMKYHFNCKYNICGLNKTNNNKRDIFNIGLVWFSLDPTVYSALLNTIPVYSVLPVPQDSWKVRIKLPVIIEDFSLLFVIYPTAICKEEFSSE